MASGPFWLWGRRKEEQMNDRDDQELVLRVGAAGGSLSVWSVSAKDGTRSFLVKQKESTLMALTDKADAAGLKFKSETGLLSSFDDALNVLDRLPWHRLYPLFVHQDFIDPVLTAVAKRGSEDLAREWRFRLEI
jgi:hypothetical protein